MIIILGPIHTDVKCYSYLIFPMMRILPEVSSKHTKLVLSSISGILDGGKSSQSVCDLIFNRLTTKYRNQVDL